MNEVIKNVALVAMITELDNIYDQTGDSDTGFHMLGKRYQEKRLLEKMSDHPLFQILNDKGKVLLIKGYLDELNPHLNKWKEEKGFSPDCNDPDCLVHGEQDDLQEYSRTERRLAGKILAVGSDQESTLYFVEVETKNGKRKRALHDKAWIEDMQPALGSLYVVDPDRGVAWTEHEEELHSEFKKV